MAAKPGVGVLSVLAYCAFFAVWATVMTSFLWFYWRVAPRALDRWAADQGYKITRKRRVGPWKRMRSGASSSKVIFDVIVRDASGKSWAGLVKVGSYVWFSLRVENCPVEATWEGPAAPDEWSE